MPWVILIHRALIGLAPVIPVVYPDDWAAAYLNRRLALALAKPRGVALSPAEAALPADMRNYGCLGAVSGRGAKRPNFVELVKRLQAALTAVPREHFQELENRLAKELE